MTNRTPLEYLLPLDYSAIELYEFTSRNDRWENELFVDHVYNFDLNLARGKMQFLALFTPTDPEFTAIGDRFSGIDENLLVSTRCIPNYTCGLIFRNEKKVVGAVSICFTCKFVMWGDLHQGYANQAFYDGLREIFEETEYIGVLER